MQDIDTTVRPGDDFFRFAAGHWLDNHPANPEYPSWNVFTSLSEDTKVQLVNLVQEVAAQPCQPGTCAQKVRDLYHLFLDTERLNAEGLSPIQPLLDQIRACTDHQQLIDLMASRHDGLFINMGVGEDFRDSNSHMLHVTVAIHNPENYTSQDPEVLKIAAIHREHDTNLLKIAGYSEEDALRIANTNWETFTQLARESMSLVDKRNPENVCNPRMIEEVQQETPWMDWQHWLHTWGFDATTEANFMDPKGISYACHMLYETPLETLKEICCLNAITEASGSLTDEMRDENYRYSQRLNGPYQLPPLEKRAVSRVVGLMGDAISQLYVERYFPKENKERMLHLVEHLRRAFAQRIEEQPWMSEETRQRALEKLARMATKIGYPDKWEDLTGLQVDPAKSYWTNVEEISEFYWQLGKRKYYNKPVDKTEWPMAPESVNACYEPSANALTFPAAILQPPFFDMQADDAANLGAIGSIIGHEMTHGFDDSGRKYDIEGNLSEWWAEEDAEAFQQIADKMSAFHDKLEALPGLKCNGKLTLGEDLADHGGLTIAYQALKNIMAERELPIIDGFTPEQRFFMAYALNWAGFRTEESIRRATLNDPHSIDHIRVNAALPHIDAWYEAFGIQPDNTLYIQPEERVKIW